MEESYEKEEKIALGEETDEEEKRGGKRGAPHVLSLSLSLSLVLSFFLDFGRTTKVRKVVVSHFQVNVCAYIQNSMQIAYLCNF